MNSREASDLPKTVTQRVCPRVYVAGPYTKGDMAVNVANAIHAASRIYDAGAFPFLPHLTHFWHMVAPRPYEDWMQLDLHWLRFCDVLLRLPGESTGADREVAEAEQYGIVVYHDIEALLTWIRS